MTKLIKTKEQINGLPIGFIEVEYLESTGTQWIDTQVFPVLDKIKLEIRAVKETGYSLFGSFENGMAFNFTGSGNYNYLRYGGGTTQTYMPSDVNKPHLFIADKGSLYVDGTLIGTKETITGTSINSIALFARLSGQYNNMITDRGSHKIYYCKIWNGSLVRDMIPVLDNSGRPCMYDLVGKKAYYNLGSGEFTYGRQIIPVEYLESTGTQYIDTGIKYKPSLSLKGKFTRNNMGTSGSVMLLSTSTINPVLYFPALNANSKIDRYVWRRAGYSEQSYYYSFSDYPVTQEVYLDAINDTLTLNGSVVKTGMIAGMNGYDSPYESASNMYLYGITNTYCGVGKIYYCTIWENTTPIRDFLPAIDENGIGFMFDRVTHSCYLNSGTGAFQYGDFAYTTKTRFIKDSRLPSGFKRVEYLEGTGTQYIDAGINVDTSTDEIKLYFQLTDTALYKWFFGEYDTNARLGLGSGDGTNLRNFLYQQAATKVSDSLMYNKQHLFEINSNGGFLDGIKIRDYTNFASTSTIYLFNLNIDSTSDYRCKSKIWKYEHKRNGVLVRDFIPVLDDNSRPAMYDNVSGQVFYNLGTGEFNYGNILPPKTKIIPSWLEDYTFVNYIESTGTQWINTGVKLTNNHSVELDYQLTQASQSRAGLYGNLATARYGTLLSPSNQYLEFGYGTSNLWYQMGLPDTQRHVIKQAKNNIYMDGSLLTSFTYTTFSIANNAPLGNFGYTNYTPAKAKYYNSKWWDGDTLIRNFIPAIRKSDNAVGMLDIVNRVFYTNSGTGVFSYG